MKACPVIDRSRSRDACQKVRGPADLVVRATMAVRPRGRLLSIGTVLLVLSASLADAHGQTNGSPAQQGAAPEHPLVPAIRLAKASLERLQDVQDYEARFVKRERINGQLITQKTRLRLRERPFSVYMHFEEPFAGREVLFVAGQNNNQLLVHEGSGVRSLVGTVSLAPDSPTVMAENRHAITSLGMRKLLKLVIEQWELESKYGEIDVKYFPQARVDDVECDAIQVSHPRPRRQFKYHVTRLFLSRETRLPIRVENYGFPPAPGQQAPLVEEYTYLDLKVNVGLTNADFDRSNPKYRF